ncbi:MAG TPA: GGDEF domain-containing protein [Planctomycetota bacterium]|nr:GGDEF domain-containing protein [Planctomycetota bacterium]
MPDEPMEKPGGLAPVPMSAAPDRTLDDSEPLPPVRTAVHPWLYVVYGADRGRHVALGPEPVTLGRSSDARVVLQDDRISKLHCAVRLLPDGTVEVEDLGSRNGTFIDGARIERRELPASSELRVGQTVLRMEHKDPEQVRLQEEMFRAAMTDPLTGLPNRRWFLEQAGPELSRALRNGGTASAVFVDADRFKQINDAHGHAAGDAVLRALADRLSGARRREDLLCRWGGEEFVLLLPGMEVAQALLFAERIRAAVAADPVQAAGLSFPVTVSLGLAGLAADDTVDALLARADAAVYRAKKNGRNRVEM